MTNARKWIWRLTVATAVIALVTLGGCKKDKDSEAGEEGSASSSSGGGNVAVGPALEAETSVLDGFAALERMPKDTVFVMAADGVEQMMDRLGRAKLVEKYKEFYDKAVAGSTEVLGVNLLDPANFAEIGLDPKGTLGLAILKIEPLTLALFFTSTDGKKVEEFAQTLAKLKEGTYSREEADGAVILTPDKEKLPAIVIGDGWTMVGGVKRDSAASLAWAKATVAMKPEDSLAKAAGFQSTLKRLNFGAGASIYLRLTELMEMAKAQAQGPEKLVFDVVAGLDTIAMGIGFSDQSVDFKLSVNLGAEAMLRKIFGTGEATPMVLRASDKEPVYSFAIQLDLEGIVGVIKYFGEKLGEDPIAKLEEGLGQMKLSLDDVIKSMTGEFGFAVTMDDDLDLNDAASMPKKIGGGAVIGLADADQFKAILAIVTRIPPVAKMVEEDGDFFAVEVPGFRKVWFGIAGDYMAVATDKGFLERVASGASGGGFAGKISTKGYRQVVQASKVSAIQTFDIQVGAWFILLRSAFNMEPPQRPTPEGASPEYVAKEKELAELRTAMKQKDEALSATRDKAIVGLLKSLGVLASAARFTDEGMEVTGGWYFRASDLPTLVMAGVDMGMTSENVWSKQEAEIRTMREQIWKLEDELRTLRP